MSESETLRLFILRHGQSELNHENIFCGWIDAHLTGKGIEQACLSAQMIRSICNENNIELPHIAYTSRLVRTQETIEAIACTLGLAADFHVKTGVNDALECLKTPTPNGNLKVIQSWRLNERHYGSWQGQRKPTVLEGCGKEDYMYIRRDYFGRPPPADLDREMVQEVNEKGTQTGYDFKEPNRKQKYDIEEATGVNLPNSESLHDVVQRFRPFLLRVIVGTLKEQGGSAIVVGHGSTVRSLLKILQNISDEDIKEVNIPNGMPLVVELNAKDNSFVRMYYLDPESAKLSAERVRNEGFI